MYTPGDVTISWKYPDSRTDNERDTDYVESDARADEYPMPNERWPLVYLPHSCDQWIIGGIEQIDQMIADLQLARNMLVQGRVEKVQCE